MAEIGKKSAILSAVGISPQLIQTAIAAHDGGTHHLGRQAEFDALPNDMRDAWTTAIQSVNPNTPAGVVACLASAYIWRGHQDLTFGDVVAHNFFHPAGQVAALIQDNLLIHQELAVLHQDIAVIRQDNILIRQDIAVIMATLANIQQHLVGNHPPPM